MKLGTTILTLFIGGSISLSAMNNNNNDKGKLSAKELTVLLNNLALSENLKTDTELPKDRINSAKKLSTLDKKFKKSSLKISPEIKKKKRLTPKCLKRKHLENSTVSRKLNF